MDHASEFVYIYEHSDCEEVDLEDSDGAESSSDAAVAPKQHSKTTPGRNPLVRSQSLRMNSRPSSSNLFARRKTRRSSETLENTIDDSAIQEDNEQEGEPVVPIVPVAAAVPATLEEHPPSLDLVPAPSNSTKKRRVRQADPNIVSFKFGKLVDPSHMQTGDPEACAECGAYLSHLSELRDAADGGKVWRCEFCDKENQLLHFNEDQRPREEDVTYMVEPAPSVQGIEVLSFDESIVVFCIDVSGSMGATVEIPGGGYISRLGGVQLAIDQQLTRLAQETPRRRVCIVTFESDVTILGDCSAPPVCLSNDYRSVQTIMETAGRVGALRPVSEMVNTIREKVRHLNTLGSTALGPGLAAALGIALQTSGSQVIMCTDGLANIGVGSLEGNEEQTHTAESFYNAMKDAARQQGVSISVTSIEGSDCRLGQLGILADATGGQVNIVNPLQLRDEFGDILDKRILATNVSATLYLHRGLYVRHEATMVSVVARDVGAVTADQEITFEYGVRRGQSDASGAIPDGDVEASGESAKSDEGLTVPNPVDDLEWVPFQLQLRYTAADGSKAVRVFAQPRRLTRDRAQAEGSVNMCVMATHAMQQTARLAELGLLDDSRAYHRSVSRKLRGWTRNSAKETGVLNAYETRSSELVDNVRRESRLRLSFASSGHRRSFLAGAGDSVANAVYRAKKMSFS